jgi:Bacterial Ig-like domain (group 3)
MTVIGVPTTLTVTSSSSPVRSGQAVTFAASVTPTDGGGTVAFYADGSSTPIPGCGSQTLTPSAVAYGASCTITLESGSHRITATYSGDSTYAGSAGTLAKGQTIEAVEVTTSSPTVALGVGPSGPSPKDNEQLNIAGTTTTQLTTPQAATGVAADKGRRVHARAPRQTGRKCARQLHTRSRQTCERHGRARIRKSR